MSLCRFGEYDVYIYRTGVGSYVCCCCSLRPPFSDDFVYSLVGELKEHVDRHRAIGDRVPTDNDIDAWA